VQYNLTSVSVYPNEKRSNQMRFTACPEKHNAIVNNFIYPQKLLNSKYQLCATPSMQYARRFVLVGC
jgi:hypothetical protein